MSLGSGRPSLFLPAEQCEHRAVFVLSLVLQFPMCWGPPWCSREEDWGQGGTSSNPAALGRTTALCWTWRGGRAGGSMMPLPSCTQPRGQVARSCCSKSIFFCYLCPCKCKTLTSLLPRAGIVSSFKCWCAGCLHLKYSTKATKAAFSLTGLRACSVLCCSWDVQAVNQGSAVLFPTAFPFSSVFHPIGQMWIAYRHLRLFLSTRLCAAVTQSTPCASGQGAAPVQGQAGAAPGMQHRDHRDWTGVY